MIQIFSYDKLRPLCYPGTEMFLLAYSITQRESFFNIKKKFIREVKYHVPNVNCVLVACKIDLRNNQDVMDRLAKRYEQPVSFEEGLKLAKHLKCLTFWETSSTTEEGFEQIGDFFTKLYYLKHSLAFKEKTNKSKTCFLQ